METRRLGSTGLEVSALGPGCMGMSYAYGSPPDRAARASLLRTAVDRGLTVGGIASLTDRQIDPFGDTEGRTQRRGQGLGMPRIGAVIGSC